MGPLWRLTSSTDDEMGFYQATVEKKKHEALKSQAFFGTGFLRYSRFCLASCCAELMRCYWAYSAAVKQNVCQNVTKYSKFLNSTSFSSLLELVSSSVFTNLNTQLCCQEGQWKWNWQLCSPMYLSYNFLINVSVSGFGRITAVVNALGNEQFLATYYKEGECK